MIEVVGCVPALGEMIKDNINWVLNSMKEEIREQASVLYAIIANRTFDEKGFENAVRQLISQTSSKSLEAQHGAILGVANCMERKIYSRKDEKNLGDWELLRISFGAISEFTFFW